MTLIHRQDNNGNQPPQGGGDQGAGNGGGDAQPTDGGQASLPFEDPATATRATTATTATTASSVTRTSPITNGAGVVPVGSGTAQDAAGFATQLSGTLTVDVPATPTLSDASATSTPGSAQPITALGLSLPVLIGIIAGVFSFLVVVLIVVIVLYRRAGRKRRAQNSLHSHDAEGSPYAGGGSRHKTTDELTPPPTPAPLSHKALMQEKQRDMAALDALVSALDAAEARTGSQRYDPSRSGPGAGSVAKLKAATAARQSDFIDLDDEDEENSEFEAKRQKRRTVDMLPDADVFRAAIAPKS